jgi:hypothetical protein
VEYLSSIGISGPLTASMIATARCFVYPNFKVQAILKPILRDEMVLSRMKKPEEAVGNNMEKLTDSEQIINMVNKAVTSISNRLNSLAHFDGTDSKVSVAVEKSKLVALTVLKKKIMLADRFFVIDCEKTKNRNVFEILLLASRVGIYFNANNCSCKILNETLIF